VGAQDEVGRDVARVTRIARDRVGRDVEAVVVVDDADDGRVAVHDGGALPRGRQHGDGVGDQPLHRVRPGRRVGQIAQAQRAPVGRRVQDPDGHGLVLLEVSVD
jgi:hypothetical protein